MVLAVLNPLEWVFCDSPQFIRGRYLDETDDETPICCIRSQRFKTPTRLVQGGGGGIILPPPNLRYARFQPADPALS